MPQYLVNRNTDNNGNHEVHETTCNNLPDVPNRVALGHRSDCHAALKKAKDYYDDVDGCYWCCRPCHTG